MTPRIKVIIEKTNTGYSAYAPDEQGIAMTTAGKTFEEIKENFLEVVEMSVEYYQEKQQWEDAERLQNAKLDFYIDVEQFFEYFPHLKYFWHKSLNHFYCHFFLQNFL